MSCVNKLERQAGQLLLVTCQVLLRTVCGEIHPEMRFVTFCSCVLCKRTNILAQQWMIYYGFVMCCVIVFASNLVTE